MKEKIASLLKGRGRTIALTVMAILLCFSAVGIHRGTQAFNHIIEWELKGIQSACERVRHIEEGQEDAYGYEEIGRDFYSSVWSNLRVLDKMAFYFPVYEDYDLTNLENFASWTILEEDKALQKRNIEIICEIAEEMEFVYELGSYKLSGSSVYNFMAAPKNVAERLKNVEELCHVY